MCATPRRTTSSASDRAADIDAQEPHAADSCWLTSQLAASRRAATD